MTLRALFYLRSLSKWSSYWDAYKHHRSTWDRRCFHKPSDKPTRTPTHREVPSCWQVPIDESQISSALQCRMVSQYIFEQLFAGFYPCLWLFHAASECNRCHDHGRCTKAWQSKYCEFHRFIYIGGGAFPKYDASELFWTIRKSRIRLPVSLSPQALTGIAPCFRWYSHLVASKKLDCTSSLSSALWILVCYRSSCKSSKHRVLH